jgi:hypothetical protein
VSPQRKNAFEHVRSLIKEHFRSEIDDDTWHLIAGAKFDLWHGPMPADADEKWPGWVIATDQIKYALNGIRDVWVNVQWDGVTQDAPDFDAVDDEGNDLEFEEDWYHVQRRDVIAAIVGKELAEYVL